MPFPKARSGFTLIEILIVITIIGILFGFSYFSYGGYVESVKLNAASKQILSDLRKTQNKAKAEHKSYSVLFSGKSYIIDSSKIVKLPSGITATDKTFKFSSSGFCPPGFSGTLVISGKKHSKKIIVSSVGRIRIE